MLLGLIIFLQLTEGGKSSQIRDFKDKKNRTAIAIIDIVDLMAPDTINYDFVKTGSNLSDEVSHDPFEITLKYFGTTFNHFGTLLGPGVSGKGFFAPGNGKGN